METVLITGAAGDIGTRLRRLLKGTYPHLRLSDVKTPAGLGADEFFVKADLADMAAVDKVVAGVDGIVHLGGFSVEGPWGQFSTPISSAATTCSRRRAAIASRAWCSPRPTLRSASIRASAASGRTPRCSRIRATA